MLTVRTKIRPSPIEGIGLFADQFISKGTIVWKFEAKLDLLFSREELKQFPKVLQEQLHRYVFFDENHEKYMLCGDDARFFNHSIAPNCDESQKDITIALSDIEPGEELTVDYKVFYGNITDHPEIN